MHTEKQNTDFEGQLSALQAQLNQRDDTEDQLFEEDKDGGDDIMQLNKNSEFANPIEITKRKEERATGRNYEKKLLYE